MVVVGSNKKNYTTINIDLDFQIVITQMEELQLQLIDLEERGRAMEQDSEMLNMLAVVTGMKTKLKDLKQQASTKFTEVQVIK